jgi:chitin disaccharide deacetylase
MAASPKETLLIVNADDLGFSPGITEGILRAHREGIVTSTTIAANMPAAEEAARLLRDCPGLGVGVHLNVSQGPPLSRDGGVLVGEDGRMDRTAVAVVRRCLLRRGYLEAALREFDAQIRWAMDHGIRPTHLDSHRHTHGFPPVFARVARLARRYHIRFVRWHHEALPGRWPAAPARQRRTRRMLNAFGRINAVLAPDLLGTNGTWGIAHTGFLDVAWFARAIGALRPGATEFMVHPGLAVGLDASQTRLLASREEELRALCDPAVRDAVRRHGITLTHYGHL